MNYKFKINNDEWEIIQVDKELIRDRFNKDNGFVNDTIEKYRNFSKI